MKTLRIAGIIILFVIAIVLIVPLFLADTVTITHSQKIEAQTAVVYHQVNTLRNWENWSPFAKADSAMKIDFSEQASGEGARQVWKSNKIGNGSLVIAVSKPYSLIENHIDFDGKGTAIGKWNFELEDGYTNVTWSTTIPELTYPLGRFMGLMMKVSMKTMLVDGLNDLKVFCEDLPAIPDIRIVDTEEQGSLSILDSCRVEEIGELLGQNYELLMQYIAKNKLDIVGAPFAIYHNWDPNGIIHIQAGIPIVQEDKGRGIITYYVLPAGSAVFAKHFGSYDTGDTHWAIEDYLNDFKLEPKSFIWESYITDPATEPDTAKWQTDIYYPLK